MSERYGTCPACRGIGLIMLVDSTERKECGYCLGTGEDGSAITYGQLEYQRDFDRDANERSDWGWH